MYFFHLRVEFSRFFQKKKNLIQFNQYCDVHVPKIQEMLDKIPTPLSGAICNEKTGWLPPNFDDNCREILTETINELLEMQPADFDPSALASTSRAALKAQANAEQAENEWEYGVSNLSKNSMFFMKKKFPDFLISNG